jgi:hypothetical protein
VRAAALGLLLLANGACAALPESEVARSAPVATRADTISRAGGGTLRSEQFTVELREGGVLVRITPLDAEVLRLAAPDTHRRLHAVAEAQWRLLAREALSPANASLFLVSFQSTEPDREFQPAGLVIEAGIERLRPAKVLPLTPGWGEQRLRPLEVESAVYAFDRPISPFQPFTVHYGATASDRWRGIIPLLQAEQRRISF